MSDSVVDNPLNDVEDDPPAEEAAASAGTPAEDDGLQKVATGMRALGVDQRYNIEKVDLRGIKRAPWVSPSCRACFYKPGPDPDGNQPAIFVVFPQMICCSVFFTYICFALPVGDACDPELRKVGEWPTDHMLFWLTGWLQCVIMYLPIPLFGVFLARIGMPMDADSDRAASVKMCGEDWPTFLKGLQITGFASLSSIFIAMALSRYWTGFPVPFTHLTAGFPGFFFVFLAVAIYLNNDGEDSPRLPQKMFQLMTMQSCIFFNIASFSILSALIKTPSLRDYQLFFALGFTMVKSITKKVVTLSLKDDFDNALPLLAFLNINAAVFPKVALPSAVSLSTYFTAAFIDVLMTVWGLKVLWLPIYKLSKAKDKVDVEQAEADEAGAKVKKLKDRLREANENLKKEQGAAQDAKAKEIEEKLKKAHAQHLKEQQDVEDAKLEKDRTRSRHDLGGLASEAILVKQGKREGETDDEFETRIGVDVDGDGDTAGIDNVELTGKGLKDAEDKEFKVVLTILEEGTEVLIPLLVVFTEVFLYYGWNGDAVPTLMELSTADFVRSTILKLVSCAIQVSTCGFAAYCVNNLYAPMINQCHGPLRRFVRVTRVAPNCDAVCVVCIVSWL
jgi:hypothetical protein